MTEYIDSHHWQALTQADPAMLCRGNRCRYLPESAVYGVTLWGIDYRIDCRQRQIACAGPVIHPYFTVFIVSYLLLDRDIRPTGEWISEKDFPGGATFFRGPHLLPTAAIGECHGNDLDSFAARCRDLGGTELAMADRAFSLAIAPEIPVAALYWRGDDDFPAEAKILYDRSLLGALALDVVYSLGVTICHRLAERQSP